MIYQRSYQVASPYEFSANCIMLDVFLKRSVAEGSYLGKIPGFRGEKNKMHLCCSGLHRAVENMAYLALGLLGYRRGTKERKN